MIDDITPIGKKREKVLEEILLSKYVVVLKKSNGHDSSKSAYSDYIVYVYSIGIFLTQPG